MNKCHGAAPSRGFLDRHKAAQVTDEDREAAKWTLGNLTHYRHGGAYETDDIETAAKAIASERLRPIEQA